MILIPQLRQDPLVVRRSGFELEDRGFQGNAKSVAHSKRLWIGAQKHDSSSGKLKSIPLLPIVATRLSTRETSPCFLRETFGGEL